MASLSVNDSTLAFSCGQKVMILSRTGEAVKLLEPPGLVGKVGDAGESDEVKSVIKNAPASVVCVNLSRCNKWLAVCSSNKQLSLWSTSSWCVLSNRILTRTASKMIFTPSGSAIVVADKSGDAYLFSVTNQDSGGDFLLGHLSLLLDVLITEDEKYIITCDRDEKIRVSRFPNSYNIQSFCLGHTEFVSGISLLPHCSSVLVSSSGDGSLRFWNYVNGKQFNKIECAQNILKHHSAVDELKTDIHQEMDGIDISEDSCSQQSGIYASNTLAVTGFCCCTLDKGTSLIAACISTFDGIAVYRVKGVIPNITVDFLEIIFIGVEPWTTKFSGLVLWCLAAKEKEPLSAFEYSVDTHKFVPVMKDSGDEVHNVVSLVNDKWELFKDIGAPSLTPMLYKRSVDNIQEYQEKKRARLRLSKCCETP